MIDGKLRVSQRREGILLHVLGDEGVLHDTSGEQIHVLNHTSRFIWDHCDGETTVEEIVNLILREYDGVEDTAVRDDVFSVLELFGSLGLIERR